MKHSRRYSIGVCIGNSELTAGASNYWMATTSKQRAGPLTDNHQHDIQYSTL